MHTLTPSRTRSVIFVISLLSFFVHATTAAVLATIVSASAPLVLYRIYSFVGAAASGCGIIGARKRNTTLLTIFAHQLTLDTIFGTLMRLLVLLTLHVYHTPASLCSGTLLDTLRDLWGSNSILYHHRRAGHNRHNKQLLTPNVSDEDFDIYNAFEPAEPGTHPSTGCKVFELGALIVLFGVAVVGLSALQWGVAKRIWRVVREMEEVEREEGAQRRDGAAKRGQEGRKGFDHARTASLAGFMLSEKGGVENV